jgi:hypothetical protein
VRVREVAIRSGGTAHLRGLPRLTPGTYVSIVRKKLQTQPNDVPNIAYLQKPEGLQLVREKVETQYRAGQMELEGIEEKPAKQSHDCHQPSPR